MTTLQDVIDRLQTLNASIPGVTSAPQSLPSILNQADLPLAMTVARGATWSDYSGSTMRQKRTLEVQFYVKQVGSGNLDDGVVEVNALLDAVGRAYAAEMHTGDCGYLQTAIPWIDSGHTTILEYGGESFHGFTVTLEISIPSKYTT